MRKIFSLLVVVLMATSCTRVVVVQKPKTAPPAQVQKTAPPGQVKKVTGSQSAKPYAPGQKKKL